MIVDAIRPLGLTRFMLCTADAREAYAKVVFIPVPERQRLMAPGTEAQGVRCVSRVPGQRFRWAGGSVKLHSSRDAQGTSVVF